MSNAWAQISELPIEISEYELTGHDREFGDFTRPSTVVHLRGGGQEGIGEDVVYDVLDHIAHRDAGPVLDLTAPTTLGEACRLLGELDLFPGAAPERDASRHYRRWAYESAALDLALRQNGLALWEVVERDPQPLRFVCSTRLGGFGEQRAQVVDRGDPQAARALPGARVQARPRERLGPGADRRDRRARAGAGARPEGHVQGHSGRRRHRSRALPRGGGEVPGGLPRGPRHQRPDPRGAGAARRTGSPGTRPCTRSPTSRRWRARRSTRSRRASARSRSCWRSTSTATRNGIAIYGGGQGELQCGRGQIQYLASLFHASTPNDVAPSGYNDPAVPAGMPSSPMDPAQSETGFRWAE